MARTGVAKRSRASEQTQPASNSAEAAEEGRRRPCLNGRSVPPKVTDLITLLSSIFRKELGLDTSQSQADSHSRRRTWQGLPVRPRQALAPHSEWVNMGLLVVLYAMQGVPLGLTLGSMWVLLALTVPFSC
jgi:hypothetical protein